MHGNTSYVCDQYFSQVSSFPVIVMMDMSKVGGGANHANATMVPMMMRTMMYRRGEMGGKGILRGTFVVELM